MPLTREQILAAGTVLPYVDVPAGEIAAGETIRVRCLTAAESQKYQLAFWAVGRDGVRLMYRTDDACARLLVLACCTVNEDGTSGGAIFSDADVAALMTLNGPLAMRLFEEAQKVSGLNHSLEEFKALFAEAQSPRVETGSTPSA